MSELTADPEFDRAAREIKQTTIEVAKSTAELISATMGATGKATEGAKLADSLYSQADAFGTFVGGVVEGDALKVGDAVLSGAIEVWELTVASAAKAAVKAGLAAHKLGGDLGTLFGTADRLKELEDQKKETERELNEVERRLYEGCGQKGGPKKEPSPPPTPGPPGKPSPALELPPSSKPGPSGPGPSQGQSQPPSTPGGEKPPDGSGGEKPRPLVSPPRPPGSQTLGLPLDCGCDSRNRSA